MGRPRAVARHWSCRRGRGAGSGRGQRGQATRDVVVTRDARHLHVVRGSTPRSPRWTTVSGATSDQVLSTEQDETVHVLDTNDALRPQQWAFNAVDFEAAWTISTGAGVTVAVVDTGVLGTHEDLAGSVAARHRPRGRRGDVRPRRQR